MNEHSVLASEINGLPEPVRAYIHDLESRADPAGDVRTAHVAREAVAALRAQLDRERLLASALAHRACTGTEHDPDNGRLHGCCVVCGVPWPCETAKLFLGARPEPKP